MAYIYLIRHTTPNVQKGICYGQTNLDVTDSYATELAQIIAKLQTLSGKMDKIYTSPLLRCNKLAKSIIKSIMQHNDNEDFSVDFLEDKRLMEMNFGDWEMKTWAHIHENDLNDWMNNFVTVKTPNGESFEDLFARVREFWEEILEVLNKEENKHQNIAIITHAGVIRAILALVLGFPLENAFRLEVNYGGICILKKSNEFIQILKTNY